MATFVITRPAPQNLDTKTALEVQGHTAILLPLTAYANLPFEWPHPDQFDAVAISSARALPNKIAPDWLSKPCFTVGETSASAAKQSGFSQTVAATKVNVHGMVETISAHKSMTKILHLGAKHQSADIKTLGDKFGLKFTSIQTYEMKSTPPTDEQAEHVVQASPDAVLHFSARAAELYFTSSLQELDAAHICLSAPIATIVAQHTSALTYVAHQPNHQAMIELAVTRFK